MTPVGLWENPVPLGTRSNHEIRRSCREFFQMRLHLLLSRSKRTKEVPCCIQAAFACCHRGPRQLGRSNLVAALTGAESQLPPRAAEHSLSYTGGHVTVTGQRALEKQ